MLPMKWLGHVIVPLEISVWQPEQCRWNPDDDDEQKAYNAGWYHGYFGLDSGYLREDLLDLYESGKRDGERQRQVVIKLEGVDPHRW